MTLEWTQDADGWTAPTCNGGALGYHWRIRRIEGSLQGDIFEVWHARSFGGTFLYRRAWEPRPTLEEAQLIAEAQEEKFRQHFATVADVPAIILKPSIDYFAPTYSWVCPKCHARRQGKPQDGCPCRR